jgi:dTDP-4-amino-4,6-dideoxygalactose transaminase
MIKFLDLQQINARHAEALKQAASRVIDSGWYLMGQELAQFENKLTNFVGAKHAVGVANGLDALRLIMRAYIELGYLQKGDEVIVPANTYIASVLAITDNDLIPVFVEPNPLTYNLDAEAVIPQITPKTKAILLVHLYGRVAWSEAWQKLKDESGLLIVEDNAQAIGAAWKGIQTGNLGHAAGFSFYPGKNLGALGDAGAVTTSNDELAQLVRALGNYGSQKKYHNDYQGYNSRLDEMQAAFLSLKLDFIHEENQLRHQVALQYLNGIKNKDIILPSFGPSTKNTSDLTNVWHLFVIRTQKRAALQQYLEEKGIQTVIHYPIPPHKQLAYAAYNNLELPITEAIHDEVLSLPISPFMSNKEILKVNSTINTFI